MSGKGDDYRPVNKKKFDEAMDRIFGKRDPLDYQKETSFSKKIVPSKSKEESSKANA